MTGFSRHFSPHTFRTLQYIGGTWRSGSGEDTLVDRNPYNNHVLAEFVIADTADIDSAYRHAADAQPAWAALNQYAKRAVFERAIRYIEDNTAKITEIIIDELGGTRLKAGFEIAMTLDLLKEAATLPLRMDGQILPSPLDDKENHLYREPVGVVGVISPFNFPFFLGMKPVVYALACGNGVVVKPHEDSPITGGTLVGEVFEAAELPAGLLNVVITEIPAIGDAFVEHPVPQVIAFTGSAAIGRHVADVAVRNFKTPLLELGGNSAFIVLADADVDLAVDAAVASRFVHQGQACIAANRILVHRDLYEGFRSKFVDRVAALPVGDPRDENTVIGPLINQKQVDTLDKLIVRAIGEDGATAALRGQVNGRLLSPTVLTDVTPSMRVMREEMFGPVVCLMPFDTEDEAVQIANDTPFGLSGAIHTRDIDHGIQLGKRLKTGMVHINDTTIHDEAIIPFGGVKESGSGRMGGKASVDAFTTTKWISVNRGRRQFPI